MSEYYGAQNDFRNYLEHRQSDGWEYVDKIHKKYNTSNSGSSKKQTIEEVNRDKDFVARFREAEKNYLRYRYSPKYGSIFKNYTVWYTTAKQHVQDAINANRALTASERTSIRQFLDAIADGMEQIARRQGTSDRVQPNTRY